MQAFKFPQSSFGTTKQDPFGLHNALKAVADHVESFSHGECRHLYREVGPILIHNDSREIVTLTVYEPAASFLGKKVELLS